MYNTTTQTQKKSTRNNTLRTVGLLTAFFIVFVLGIVVGWNKSRIKSLIRNDSTVNTSQADTVSPVLLEQPKSVNEVSLKPSQASDNDPANQTKNTPEKEPVVDRTDKRPVAVVTNTQIVGNNIRTALFITNTELGDTCVVELLDPDLFHVKESAGKVILQEGGIYTCDAPEIPFVNTSLYRAGTWRIIPTITSTKYQIISLPVTGIIEVEPKQ